MKHEAIDTNEASNSEVRLLSRQIEETGIDTTNTEEVVKLAHLLFGDSRPTHEVEIIINHFFEKERAAAALADERAT